MTFFRKKADPISARSRELNAQISALEQEIQRLSANLGGGGSSAGIQENGLRTAAAQLGHGRAAAPPIRDPVFERVQSTKAKAPEEIISTAGHYNDLGVRKYDLFGAVRRAKRLFGAAPAENPKLLTYLAAGSVKGLKPLRYEKRVARNRFLFLSIVFSLILWGLLAAFFSQR